MAETATRLPQVDWKYDAVEECWVDFTRGWAISVHALGELGEDALGQVKAGALIKAADPELLRVWFERRYGECEGPGC